MTSLLHFLTYNLAASVLAGLVMATVIIALARALGIRDARTRNSLLGLALVKSTLVLAGLGLVLPLPEGLWQSVREQAVPANLIVPVLLLWSGLLTLGHELVRRRAVDRLPDAAGDPAASRRMSLSVGRVLDEIKQHDKIRSSRFCCTMPRPFPSPRTILTGDRGSPAMISHGAPPILLMPAELVPLLDDGELDAIVAHELGHVLVEAEQSGCTARWARWFRFTSPTSLLFGRLLDREQELACDEVAAQITSRPAAVASALLKTYRFQREKTALMPAPVAHLLPHRPLLQQRLRRLTNPGPVPEAPSRPRLLLVWFVTGFLLFAF